MCAYVLLCCVTRCLFCGLVDGAWILWFPNPNSTRTRRRRGACRRVAKTSLVTPVANVVEPWKWKPLDHSVHWCSAALWPRDPAQTDARRAAEPAADKLPSDRATRWTRTRAPPSVSALPLRTCRAGGRGIPVFQSSSAWEQPPAGWGWADGASRVVEPWNAGVWRHGRAPVPTCRCR